MAHGEYIGIYDADAMPEKNAIEIRVTIITNSIIAFSFRFLHLVSSVQHENKSPTEEQQILMPE